MTLAIEEGKKGIGFVAPNPPVGCVIVDKNHNLLAKGNHKKFGQAHAEIDALSRMINQEQLEGATFYVTLEPCSHQGKTPSCAQALAKMPIHKVVYGLSDPNPLVSGRGIEILKEAGIACEKFSGLEAELESLPEHFLMNHRHKKSFVSLKAATSLDGQMAHVSGKSQWITGEESRRHTHYLRASHDAIIIGKNTILQDNPRLDVRHERFPNYQNKVIILDSSGELGSVKNKLNVIDAHLPEDIIIATTKQGAKRLAAFKGVHWILDEDKNKQVCLKDLVARCFSESIYSLFVEGGSRVIGSFINQGLAHRYYQFIAPVLVGAPSGQGVSSYYQERTWDDRIALKHATTSAFGNDIMFTGLL